MNTNDHPDRLAVAIIGMAGRFPAASNVDQLWANVRDKRDCVTHHTAEMLEALGWDPIFLRDPNFVPSVGKLKDIELFDAEYFGISPREAEVLDPQHRIFLETVVQALQAAAVDPQTYPGRIGLYAGVGISRYALNNLIVNTDLPQESVFDATVGNMADTLATRAAFLLGLTGPCYSVQTNCSTSMVAVHIATQAVLNGECDVAMAGGSFLTLAYGHSYVPGGINSQGGKCRAFDADGTGAPGGEGAAVVIFKRLEEAIEDRDNILAVILGSAINNDGSRRFGFTAPSVEGQYEVIAEALESSEIDPSTVDFVQAHGSGTEVGDPIEITALTRAYGAGTKRRQFIALGSVKPNLGHLDRAAGVTNLIAAVQALRHRQIPPLLHFERPNPKIDFESSPFYVPTTLGEWPSDSDRPRRAGVTGLGIGGTNAHLILEEAPPMAPSGPSRPRQLILLSAKTESALEQMTDDLADVLTTAADVDLADIAFTLQVGRTAWSQRRMLVCHDREDAAAALRSRDPSRLLSERRGHPDRPVVFMFSGLGDHYADMGLDLYRGEASFREAVDRCAEILRPLLGEDLRQVLYPRGTAAARDTDRSRGPDLRQMISGAASEDDEANRQLRRTIYAQPALFVVEYALARTWMAWGLRPEALLGFSVGELTAACIAGVLTLEDALTLAAKRAALIGRLVPGAMLAVPLSEEEVHSHLSEELGLSAINAPELCVVAGPTEAVEGLDQRLRASGIVCRRLPTTHAFHSTMMAGASEDLGELVRSFELRSPEIPWISTVTGTWADDEEVTTPEYWVRHLLGTVRLSSAIATAWREPDRLLLEIGPGNSLTSLALQNRGERQGDYLAQASMRNVYETRDDVELLLGSLGKLWLSGVRIDWRGFSEHESRRRLELPAYPFERKKFWIEASKALPPGLAGRKRDPADWFNVPVWRQSLALPRRLDLEGELRRWLILVDELGLGHGVAQHLVALGHEVVTVEIGERFEHRGESRFALDPRDPESYARLLSQLKAADRLPQQVAHFWSISPPDTDEPWRSRLEAAQDLGFYSLLYLTQALGDVEWPELLRIHAFTNNAHEVLGDDLRCPEKATIVGIYRAIPKEYAQLRCGLADLDLRDVDPRALDRQIEAVLEELTFEPISEPVAYRQDYRWLRTWDTLRIDERTRRAQRLRQRGVYLVTGGLGGLALGLSEHLVRHYDARLILIGRSGLIPSEEWDDWLATHDEDDRISYKIRQVQKLEELGGDVLIRAADVCDLDRMREVVDEGRQRFGHIHGVIHTAGVPGAGIIHLKTKEMADAVLAPKLIGVTVLDELFRDGDLDFMVYYSSMTAMMTGFGEVDYSAANNFLDAFAYSARSSRSYFALSLGWPAWQWDDWQDELLESMPELRAQIKRGREIFGLRFEEGSQALVRALSSHHPYIVISALDLERRLWSHEKWTMHGVMAGMSGDEDGETKIHARPATINSPFVEATTEAEKKIVQIWRQFLGIDQIGIHDNYFELGGHSMLGTQVMNQIREIFDVDVGIPLLYEAQTIAELAAHIEGLQAQELEEPVAV